MAGAAELLDPWRCALHLPDDLDPPVDAAAVLARARVALLLHEGDWPAFAWVRAAQAVQHGCAVVTEAATGLAPLEPGVAVVAARADAAALLAVALLEDEGRRAAQAAAAAGALAARRGMRAGAERLLALAADRADAAAPRRTAPAPVPEVPPPPDVAADASDADRRARAKADRLAMIDARRAVARARAGARADAAEVLAATPAWSAGRPAEVSVLVSVFEHAEVVAEALTSVGALEDVAVEVVVVDDGSTDGSARVVRRWMDACPDVPALLLRHVVNQGLPAARNRALARARAPRLRPGRRQRGAPARPGPPARRARRRPRGGDGLRDARDVRRGPARTGCAADTRGPRRACATPTRSTRWRSCAPTPCARSAAGPTTRACTGGRTTTCGAPWPRPAATGPSSRPSWRATGSRPGRCRPRTTDLSTRAAVRGPRRAPPAPHGGRRAAAGLGSGTGSIVASCARMRDRLRISPERYFVVACVALVALTLIVFTGAAVRVTGSGLGCPELAELLPTGAWSPRRRPTPGSSSATGCCRGFVGVAAIAAGLLAFVRRPFRRDLAVLGVLLPLGVVGQAVLGGLTVCYGLAPGLVMGHYLLSMLILVAAGALAWRAQPGVRAPASRRRPTARRRGGCAACWCSAP